MEIFKASTVLLIKIWETEFCMEEEENMMKWKLNESRLG